MQQLKHFKYEETDAANKFIKEVGIKMQNGSHLSPQGITIIYEDGVFNNVAKRESVRESKVKAESEVIALESEVRTYSRQYKELDERKTEVLVKIEEINSKDKSKESYDEVKSLEKELEMIGNYMQNAGNTLLVNKASQDKLASEIVTYVEMIEELDEIIAKEQA